MADQMSDELFPGKVLKFAREQGFGTVELEDGRQIPFDAFNCTYEPKVGDPVRVRVGVSRLGKPKALRVERPDEKQA
jgi:cold shock CspA family protein